MEEKEIQEIQNLGDDELLEVYQLLVDHIQYLNSNIIDTTIDETPQEGGETANE
jgi:hypothetical protein